MSHIDRGPSGSSYVVPAPPPLSLRRTAPRKHDGRYAPSETSTDYSKSATKLKEEADAVRKRLEKEREAVAASQAEAAAARKAQEQERAEAQAALARVMAELDREKKV